MKIIIAPSKTQDVRPSEPVDPGRFLDGELTLRLFAMMKELEPDELGRLLKIRGGLLDEVGAIYRTFDPGNLGSRSIDCYQGVVFGGLECSLYTRKQKDFLNETLVILSAMYGALEPDTPIWPYRLDLTNKPCGLNLTALWRDKVEERFRKEDLIVNLASSEFSRLLSGAKERILNLHFLDRQPDGSLKAVSVHAKQARGRMADRILKEGATRPEEFKELGPDGYHYDPASSDAGNFIYVRND